MTLPMQKKQLIIQKKKLIANTIDFIINNRQKIDLTKNGMPEWWYSYSAKVIQQAFQYDDLANTDKETWLFRKIPGKNTIDFIINNRQKIALTKKGVPHWWYSYSAGLN